MFKEVVLSHLLMLARPVVRLCLRHGIKLGELLDVVKRAFVVEASRQLEQEGEGVSTSRISVMTGVHRTDVAQIRTEKSYAPRERHIASDVINQWRFDAKFCTKPGRPRPLSLDGKNSEFADLVKMVSHSISPYTVSFELERLGMVSRNREGKLVLRTRVFVPKGDPGSVLSMLAEDVDDLIVAVESNAFADETQTLPNHHLKTEYSNIPDEVLPEVREWCLREGSAFHERARNFLSKFDKDINPQQVGSGVNRIVVGSFSLIEGGIHSTQLDPRESEGEEDIVKRQQKRKMS